jgi:thiamine transporter
MQSNRTRILVEIALTIALSAAVKALAIRLPWNIAGGTVSFEMLPIFVLALRRGVWPAVAAGAMFGMIDLILEPFVVHPVQLVLDYPLAFALVGVAGIGAGLWHRGVRENAPWTNALVWGLFTLGAFARFLSHFVSGYVFFQSNAVKAGQAPALYSAIYNASYIVPSLLICAAVAVVILPVLEKRLPSSAEEPTAVPMNNVVLS